MIIIRATHSKINLIQLRIIRKIVHVPTEYQSVQILLYLLNILFLEDKNISPKKSIIFLDLLTHELIFFLPGLLLLQLS